MPPSGEKDCRPRVVVDTSVVVAGISGFKRQALERANFNAQLMRKWIEDGHFVWLYSEDILDEYRYVLAKRGVSKSVIGRLINLLKEEGEEISVKRYDSFSECPPASTDGDGSIYPAAPLRTKFTLITVSTSTGCPFR